MTVLSSHEQPCGRGYQAARLGLIPALSSVLRADFDPLAFLEECQARAHQAVIATTVGIPQQVRLNIYRAMQVVWMARGLCRLGMLTLCEAGQNAIRCVDEYAQGVRRSMIHKKARP